MSITDVAGTDRHIGEVIPSAHDDSAKVAEDQPQEEGSDEKQQNQSWIATSKPAILSQGPATEAIHSLEASEDYAFHYLTRRYMQKLWIDSKVFAEHAGRRYLIFEDANMVFGKLMFSAAELHAFMKQVQYDPLENSVPFFPVRKSSPYLLSIYGPVSDKELAIRPEHIPRYFPAMYPEWCSSHVGVQAADVSVVKGVPKDSAKSHKSTPRGRVIKPKISFPDFSGSTAKELGFVRPQKLPSTKMVEEPSGISSSANIAALQMTGTATSSAIRTKPRKWSVHESASSSKNCDEHHLKAEIPEEDAPDKSFVQRSIGMFGMPPSTLVHPESIAADNMKKKKKNRDRDRDKNRTKEKKVKHRDKEKPTDKNEENPNTSSSVSVTIKSLTNERASTTASCATDAKSDGQANKPGNQQQDVLSTLHKQRSSPKHYQRNRDGVDLKNFANEKPVIKVHFSHTISGNDEEIGVCREEDDTDKLKHEQPMDLNMNDGQSASNGGLQMIEVLTPQHFANRTGDVEEDDISDGSKALEKVKKEGVKDEAQKIGKENTSKNALDEIDKDKLERRKVGEKGNEWKKIKKTTTDISLSGIVSGITKCSTTDNSPTCKDLKTLKVVLSRSTGQKIFTALSPSSGIERAVKELERKCDPGIVQGGASATLFTIDESQVAEDICEKRKKHRKEKGRDKHHSKEHKRKDKKKCKEHKKSKTKDKEKKYIKLRPEKLCFKRPGELILPDGMPALKIPKLKIRFGSNSSGISASPSDIVSATSSTILASTLSSSQLAERDAPSLIDQNVQVKQPTVKLESTGTTTSNTSFKSGGNIRPRKRQPVTKAELKALPKLPLKARTCGTKEGSGFTGGQGPAEVVANSVTYRADAGFEQRNYLQQPTGKRLRVDDGKKEFLGSYFDTYGAAAFSSAEKMLRAMENERNSVSCFQGMTPKGCGQLASVDSFSTLLSDGRRQENESIKRDVEEILRRKSDQVHAEAQMDSMKPRLGKEKDPFKRVCDGDLLFDKEKLFVKDRFSGKLKGKDPEDKKRERHHSLEKMKENGRERGSHHMQKAPEKERDQGKRDEKGVGIESEKKEAQQDLQKEKEGDRENRSDESDKGKRKKMGMVGVRSEVGSGGCATENNKHREKLEKIAGSGQRRKRKSVDKDEESGKSGEKDAKKYAKERRCSSETKERGKHHNERTVVEEKVKSCGKELKDKEKRKKHSSGRGKEHSIGKNIKEIEKASSGKDESFGDSNNVKTKNSGKEITVDPNNSHLSYDTVQKAERVVYAREQLSKRCSADSDILGSGSSTADSLAKSSDKKSSTLDSDDSLDTMWICPECSVAYVEGATDMVGCDACDNWFHWSCVGLLVAPPDDAPWYCQNCAKKKLKKKNVLKSSTSKKSKK